MPKRYGARRRVLADGFASIGGQDSADQHRRWVRLLVWRSQRRRKRGHQAGKHYGYTYASKKSLDSIIDKLRRFTRRASIAHSPTCCAGSTTWPEVGAATFGPGGEARCGNVRESRRQHCRACAAETGQLGDPSGRVSTESLLIIRAASSSDPDWRSYPASERRTLGMFLVDS